MGAEGPEVADKVATGGSYSLGMALGVVGGGQVGE
jgi:hypothetical protein